MNKNIFIVRKYVIASSIADALKKEKTTPVADVWLDEQCKNLLVDAVYRRNEKTGFQTTNR